MAEWFVGPKLKKLIDNCSEYLQDQFIRQTSVKERLTRLQENHPKIQALVSAASLAGIIDPTAAVDNLIWPLRDAIDEADDVLDEIEYTKRKEQLAGNMDKVHCAVSWLKKIGKRALKIDPNLKRVHKSVQKLDKILAELIPILLLLGNITQGQQNELHKYRVTGCFPRNDLIGRDKDKEFVIQWLRKTPPNEDDQMRNNISLLSIVGHGGMGKTALLQHVYGDKITDEFELKMWVWVSNNFNAEKVIADMLAFHEKVRLPSEPLDALQKSLKSEVMSKRFLLVLDDIWEEDEEKDKMKWENVLAPLAHGGLGSKLLITTRMNSAASMIAEVINTKNEVLKLEGLEEDECLQILNTHAFADIKNPDDHKELRSITGELVKKLSGTPLEAEVMGYFLKSSLDETHWRNELNSDFLAYNHDIIPILKLSYTTLPIYLRNCFAFCSVFAPDHVFDKDDLVRMWIAVGFIQSSCVQGETVEKIGVRYFNMLVKKSIFDKTEKGYKMHYLLHELARSVSAQECFRIVGDEDSDLRIPETIRHLSVETSNLELLKKMGKFKDLRTLRITYEKSNHDFIDVLTKIFEESRSIRLLSICSDGQKTIPVTIGTLKHLRYLHLEFPTVTSLPRSVSKLYHLQFLICNCDVQRDQIWELSDLHPSLKI